jgi:HPt (histidine-containing phosphotransfer) domain-containing protein
LSILVPPKHIPPEVYKKLVFIFLEEISTDFNTLKVAIEKNDFPGIKRVTHKIGGVASSYGAVEVSNAAIAIQTSENHIRVASNNVQSFELAIEKLIKHINSTYVQPSV